MGTRSWEEAPGASPTGKVGLTVNEEKTRTCSIPDGSFDFLGYTFGRCYSTKTGRAYLFEVRRHD